MKPLKDNRCPLLQARVRCFGRARHSTRHGGRIVTTVLVGAAVAVGALLVVAPATAVTAPKSEVRGPGSVTPTAAERREPGMSPEAARVYAQTDAMMRRSERAGTAREMLRLLEPVVRAERHPLLVGRLVVAAAAVASDKGGREAVDQLLQRAATQPDDPISAFVAGVAVHYRGHVRGRSRDEKSADYRRAIELLQPLREAFSMSPRLWIYLAVSYIRTGRQAEAERAIARAVDVDSGSDADVYYCRAEVYHRTDPKRALQDIDRYIAIMARNKRAGAFSAVDKEQKVAHMRALMVAVTEGKRPPGGIELFDPIRDPAPLPSAALTWAWRGVGAAGLLVAIGWVRRLRKRAVSQRGAH